MSKPTRKLTNSPFRYPGGKFYARKLILASIPEHDRYCELFAGGASIFFAKENAKYNILNDKDEELINCYIQIQNNVDRLISLLHGIPATKELHYYYKNEYKPSNDVERAMRWFYLNRTSYSGIMKLQNCYWGYGDRYSMRPENWASHLRTTSERLQNIDIYCLDFEDLINLLPSEFFLFIDPPYFNADRDKFYTVSFTQEDHERLCQLLKKNQHKFQFLITYDNSLEIREMYSWCISMQDTEWNYTISRTDDQKNGRKLKDGYQSQRYKGREIFIANYDIQSVIGVKAFQVDRANQEKIENNNLIQLSLFQTTNFI